MAGEFTFLPFLRSGLTARAKAPVNGYRRRVGVGVRPLANGGDQGEALVKKYVEIHGAGDVQGVSPMMIAAVEPRKGSKSVEPNYFPYIDFVDSDFPWRYSLDVSSGKAKGRVKPWLSLIVLFADEFSFVTKGATPLSAIEVSDPSQSLPNLSTAWVSAHVQINAHDDASATLAEHIESDPTSQFSRLICPRRLSGNTAYHAFLVPLFEAGRLAGLGEDAAPSPWNGVAWDHASGDAVRLPYYFTWRFRTDDTEDFESLVRRLAPNTLSSLEVGGTRTVSTAQPNYFTDTNWPLETIEAEAAITMPGFVRDPQIIEQSPLTQRLAETLTKTLQSDKISSGEQDGPEVEDPLITLPVYGRYYTDPETIDHEPTDNPWTHEINLDLRLRLGAGAGTAIVKRAQEDFISQCWAQSGDIQEANQTLSKLQAVEKVNSIILSKYVASVPAEVTVAMSLPFHDLVDAGDGVSMTKKLRQQGVPSGVASRTMRRAAAKRPVVTMKAARDGTRKRRATIASSSIYLSGNKRSESNAAALLKKRKRLSRAARRTMDKTLSKPLVSDEMGAALGNFNLDATAPVFRVGEIDVDTYKANLITRIEALPLDKAVGIIDPGDGSELSSLDPITKTPKITSGLADHLVKYDRNFLLSGVAGLPHDSVTLGEENRPFIESILAGANHEMIKELVWREFPVEKTETVFSRFWDKGNATASTKFDDVLSLDQWENSAGDHFLGGDEARLILIIRGELINRYPDVQVGIVNMSPDELSGFSLDSEQLIEPQFSGRIGNRTAYYGFDLTADEMMADPGNFSFAIFQPMGRFRFGLDIATRTKRRNARLSAFREAPETLDDLSWSHMDMTGSGYIDFTKTLTIADGSDQWGDDRNSASIAMATLQKPVCALIRAARLLGDG